MSHNDQISTNGDPTERAHTTAAGRRALFLPFRDMAHRALTRPAEEFLAQNRDRERLELCLMPKEQRDEILKGLRRRVRLLQAQVVFAGLMLLVIGFVAALTIVT